MPMYITLYYFTVILITRALAILPIVMPLSNIQVTIASLQQLMVQSLDHSLHC